MKRFAIAVLFLGLAATVAADEKREKRFLIGELMKVMDAPGFHRSVCAKIQPPGKENDRILARMDFGAIADATDVEVFDRTFTADELRELIAFLKTKTGQKTLQAVAEAIAASMPLMDTKEEEASQAVYQDEVDDRYKRHPWLRTLDDLRTIAGAAEAYATDNNHYPAAASIEELRTVLEPTYVRTLPLKDFWGNPFVWHTSPDGQHYRIISTGADGQMSFDSEIVDVNARPKESESLDDDIIYQDDVFIRLPKSAESR